jgi:hypothetical protein
MNCCSMELTSYHSYWAWSLKVYILLLRFYFLAESMKWKSTCETGFGYVLPRADVMQRDGTIEKHAFWQCSRIYVLCIYYNLYSEQREWDETSHRCIVTIGGRGRTSILVTWWCIVSLTYPRSVTEERDNKRSSENLSRAKVLSEIWGREVTHHVWREMTAVLREFSNKVTTDRWSGIIIYTTTPLYL